MNRLLFAFALFLCLTTTYAQDWEMLGEGDATESLDAATAARLQTALNDDPAVASLESGDLAAVETQLNEAGEPTDAAGAARLFYLNTMLADKHLGAGDTEKANAAFTSAQEIEDAYFSGGERTEEADFKFLLDAGHVYYSLDKDAVALKRFADAFKIMPKGTERTEIALAAYRLSNIYSVDGNTNLALRWLTYALKAGILDVTDEAGEKRFDLNTVVELKALRATEEFAGLKEEYEF